MSAVALSRRRTRRVIIAATAALATAAGLTITLAGSNSQQELLTRAARSFLADTQAGEVGAGAESEQVGTAIQQFNDARMAPGFAMPGGYDQAVTDMGNMAHTTGSWEPVTNVPYNADDTRYRDYSSNSSSGVGFVTGRVQALAADGQYLYAAGAVGGVARQSLSDPSGAWIDLSAGLPALAGGALAFAPDGSLWFATGDGSTGSTTYVGDGVWVLTNPDTTDVTTDPPVWIHLGADRTIPNTTRTGSILNGAVIQHIYFAGDSSGAYTAYVPTSYGIYAYPVGAGGPSTATDWTPVWQPNPNYLPGGTSANSPAPGSGFDRNWISDIALDPNDATHMIAAFGWVAGGAANGWYDGRQDTNGTWKFTRINPKGAVLGTNIGRTSFAFADRGKVLYALVQDPAHASTGAYYSELQGVYVSRNGSLMGPWNKIADAQKLANSGSALKPTVPGAGLVFPGYSPGVQAWYNQFLAVDPNDANHVFVGLEEVYQTTDQGRQWQTIGPYWNFFFPCWSAGYTGPSDTSYTFDQQCPLTPHPDQHAIVIVDESDGAHAIVGNDGGIYDWPLNGDINSLKHGASWIDRTQSYTPDFLQYYSVAVGKQTYAEPQEGTTTPTPNTGLWGTAVYAAAGDTYDPNGVIVSGGLQDNGGSILLSQDTIMGSNFGGDGGDSLVDPGNGCNIVQEYVMLSMSVTNNCASPTDNRALIDQQYATTRDIAPQESAARFIAPFAADHQDINHWIAGGQHIWYTDQGFGIQDSSGWTEQFNLGTNSHGASYTATAVAASGGDAVVGYCGSCNPGGYEGGIAYGPLGGDPTDWTRVPLGDTRVVDGGTLPNRYVGGVDVYQDGSGVAHYLLAFNGFSRRWTEGPGAGIGHVFVSSFDSTGNLVWTDITGNLPDVPLSTIKWFGHNANGKSIIVAGSDLGAYVTDDGGTTWFVIGGRASSANPQDEPVNLPMSVVTDLEPGPDGYLYAATYGRGIWKIKWSDVGLGAMPQYAGTGISYADGGSVTSGQTETVSTTTASSGGSGHGPATKPSSPASPPANGNKGNNGKRH